MIPEAFWQGALALAVRSGRRLIQPLACSFTRKVELQGEQPAVCVQIRPRWTVIGAYFLDGNARDLETLCLVPGNPASVSVPTLPGPSESAGMFYPVIILAPICPRPQNKRRLNPAEYADVGEGVVFQPVQDAPQAMPICLSQAVARTLEAA